MRLLKIRPQFFRGFGDSEWLVLDSALVLLAGPNGYGKSSLAESIEWLLYGRTKRRKRGEQLSKLDYRGSYRNVHAPDNCRTEVEAVVKTKTSGKHKIKRVLVTQGPAKERSETYVDGEEGGWESIGLPSDQFHDPVVAQHTLKYFIHATPKERRDRISAALGLDSLVRFKSALDGGRRRFMQSPPEYVREATQRLDAVISDMRVVTKLEAVANRWSQGEFDLEADTEFIEDEARRHFNIKKTSGELTGDLRAERQLAVHRLFDMARIEPPSSIDEALENLRTINEEVAERAGQVSQAATSVIDEGEGAFSRARISFWQSGLEIAQRLEPSECPMCEEQTLPAQKKEMLRKRIDDAADLSRVSERLSEEVEAFDKWLEAALEDVEELFPPFLDDEEREKLTVLVSPKHRDELEQFLNWHDTFEAVRQDAREEIADLRENVSQSPDALMDIERVGEAGDLIANLENDLSNLLDDIRTSASQYRDFYNNFFSPILRSVISDAEEVAQVGAFLSPLEARDEIRILALYNELLDESLDVLQDVEVHIGRMQDARLKARGKDISHWYELMNPGANVTFDRIEWGTDKASLWATSFGIEMNAVANFSQAQLNCLGLSLHLMRSRSRETPFDLLVLDDPVQSMDVDHCEALVTKVFGELLDEEVQLLLCSQIQGLIDRVYNLYYHSHKPLRLRISDFERDGPVIQAAESLQSVIYRAKQLAKGNDEHRRDAVLGNNILDSPSPLCYTIVE